MTDIDFNEQSPESLREIGKMLCFGEESTPESRKEGLRCINIASNRNDGEAQYLMGRFFLDGVIKSTIGDSVRIGMNYLYDAAKNGFSSARAYLNAYCKQRYNDTIGTVAAVEGKPLCDFSGKRIVIDRKGIRTPIDAKLQFVNGENVLTLSTNISFLKLEDGMTNPDKFYDAVVEGIREWAGDYIVFGGQRLKVIIHLTFEERIFDYVGIIPVTGSLTQKVEGMGKVFEQINPNNQTIDLIRQKRSFAAIGLRKWSVTSRKIIFIQSKNGRFDDYNEIKAVAKHEFGHALGLGDLYESPSDGLEGVETGKYKELDCFVIDDKFYNLVMCEHHGPISNNDIEMVVLAFSKNKIQEYQMGPRSKKISEALGRGN